MKKFERKDFIYLGKILLLAVLFYLIAGELGRFLYKYTLSHRSDNIKMYILSLSDISKYHLYDSFFTVYHLYFLNIDMSWGQYKRYFEFLTKLAGTLIFLFSYLRFGWKAGIIFGSIFILHPIFLIHIMCIVFPDKYQLLFSILLLILFELDINSYTKKGLFFVLMILGLFNHYFQFAIVAASLLGIFFIYDEKKQWHYLIIFVLALIVARFAAISFFEYKGFPIQEYRYNVAKSITYEKLIDINFDRFDRNILSYFLGLFPFFLWNLISKKNWLILLLALGCYIVSFWTFDTTRVFVHLFFPGWIYLMLKKYKEEEDHKIDFAFLGFAFLFNALVPLWYAWDGKIIFLI